MFRDQVRHDKCLCSSPPCFAAPGRLPRKVVSDSGGISAVKLCFLNASGYIMQEFTADQTSRAVKRINDVAMLRASQFSEDGGPMAHPIRPDSYLKMVRCNCIGQSWTFEIEV